MTRQGRELIRLRRALQLIVHFDQEASGEFAADVLAGGDPDALAHRLLDAAEQADREYRDRPRYSLDG